MPPYPSQPQSSPSFPAQWPVAPGMSPSLGPPLRSEPRRPPTAPPIAQSQQYLLYLAEIGENTAALVHDMRSPLSVIINGLRLCQRMPLPQIARQRLALALDEAERLNRIVTDVIAFARCARPSEFQPAALDQPVYLAPAYGVSRPPDTPYPEPAE